MRTARWLGVLAAAAFVLGRTHTALGEESGAEASRERIQAEFLKLCDRAVTDLASPMRTVPFYNDSYAVRALCVAYDLTGKRQYLDACRKWAARMEMLQAGMRPVGAYNMNYGRKPGGEAGNWYVADSSSIAMGVLATAVRCGDPAEKERYLGSVKAFAKLVIDNYVTGAGGIRNGLWPKYNGPWWCSSGIFGSLMFLLHGETHEQQYLDVAVGALDWLNNLDLTQASPYSAPEMGPTLHMYVLEAYSAGMPYLKGRPELQAAATKRWSESLDWMAQNQGSRAKSTGDGGEGSRPALEAGARPAVVVSTSQASGAGDGAGRRNVWKYESQWGSKFGGLPFHMYVYARQAGKDTSADADRELRYIFSEIAKEKGDVLTQLDAFAMMSCAERLRPGAVYRPSK